MNVPTLTVVPPIRLAVMPSDPIDPAAPTRPRRRPLRAPFSSQSTENSAAYTRLVETARELHAELADRVRASTDPAERTDLLAKADAVLDAVTAIAHDQVDEAIEARLTLHLHLTRLRLDRSKPDEESERTETA